MYYKESTLSWDTQRRKKRAKFLANSIFDGLGNAKKLEALEIGCGDGLISFELKDKFQEIYCFDGSKEMLNLLNEKIIYYDAHNLYTCNMDSLKKDDYYEKFDVVYSSMIFHHINNIEEKLKTVHKLMKKDGSLAIIDLDKASKFINKEEKNLNVYYGLERDLLQEIIEKSGFKDVNFQTVNKCEDAVYHESVSYSLFLCTAKK